KIRGSNAIKQIQKLNPDPKDYLNSIRVILGGAEDQILNPKLNIGFTTKELKLPHNQSKGVEVPTKVPEVLQTGKIQTQPQIVPAIKQSEVPQVPKQVEVSKADSSSKVIIPQEDKYAFNINKERLGLKGESARKLDEVVEQMRPVLEKRKGAPLTNKQIIIGGRKAVMLDTVMSREESAQFLKALQASRNFLKSESAKKGLSPEFLAQLEIVSSQASDKGRSLRAFAVDAENSTIKEAVVRDLQKLGIKTKRLIEASKNVDWDNASEVTAFYRKFKPASILEMLEEYRYTNMLSSPLTQIVNIFSNFLQGGIVAPIEKTITGTLDFARSRLTGSEQKYFASQGVDYAKAYWKALPEGFSKFKSIVLGDGGLRKPDVDFIPTGTGKLHKLYTTPLRALEGMDQLARTMVTSGELKSLEKVGITGAEALKRAEASADYRTFRQAFDPDGKLGQGGLLQLWDKWNVGVNQLRHLPGGKWIVPFLQTPTNILKQGVEYSPLGIATVKGSKEPMVQLSKAIIGSGVFATAYALADSGLTTWDTPTNAKDREAFYEAGLQPYSIKMGDKWVSYSKLGPISYPIAMASAMKWAKDNGANDNIMMTAGKGSLGFLQFFADQSYMQGIGDVIDAVRGDEYKQGRSLANIPSQLIPYRALQGWIAKLIDPVYRKTSGGSVPEQMGKSIISQIPFASKSLEPYVNSKGEESKRYAPLFNAFSPLRTSQELSSYEPVSSKGIYGEISKMKTPQEKAAKWDELVKSGRITKANVSDIKDLISDDTLKVTASEKNIRKQTVKDGDRARAIKRQLDKAKTPAEKAALWDSYVKKGIITTEVAKQLKILLSQ
ncbi:hypothetical protein M0R04_16105, partial [Candidatus Dojkabacteria bacterium]|nr:hypothetical protein [Candidatus Dojkabacteria bacterium]